MKKQRIILIFFLALALIPLAFAQVDIQFTKQVYSPGETLQAEIFGNFPQGLNLENIHFYRERNIPVVYDIFKTKDKYLLYAILPYTEGNYTIKIEDAEYTTETGISTDKISEQFEIESSNQTILTVNPGFVVSRGDFSVNLKSNKNQEITAEFEATGEQKKISLVQNTEKKVSFSASGISNYTEANLKVADYAIPVFIFPEKTQEEIIEETEGFRFSPMEIKATILKSQDFSFKIFLMNLGDLDIKNIDISVDSDKSLKTQITPNSISVLEAGQEKSIELTISSEKTGDFYGTLLALSASPELEAELKIGIYVSENKSEVRSEISGYTEETSCSDIGEICSVGEECDGSLVFTQEGYCCDGTCKSQKTPTGYGWLWGIIIIVLVIAALGALFYLMKKRQGRKENVLESRRKKFEQRMNPRSEEIRGGLTRE